MSYVLNQPNKFQLWDDIWAYAQKHFPHEDDAATDNTEAPHEEATNDGDNFAEESVFLLKFNPVSASLTDDC